MSCKCIRSCKDSPNEVDLAKGDYLRSKSSNFKINNNPSQLGYYKKSRIQSCVFKCKNSEYKIKREIDNINPKEKIKDTIPPTILEDSEENKYQETNNYPIKTVPSLNNMNDKIENPINYNKDKLEKNEINNNDNLENNININSEMYKIKCIPNLDKNIFITEKLKKAEKNFSRPLNYETDWQKYNKENDENEDMIVLINSMNDNKETNKINESGIIIEYNGEQYLYIGKTDKNQLPSGRGILYTQGEKYEGNFYKGKLLGLGRYIDDEGICYEGIFEENKLISKATVIKMKENGKKVEYFGELVDFKKEGKGEEICENEYKYTGDFFNNVWHGEGQLENYETGDLYHGEFENGEITGKGLFKWKNGEIYEGNFLKGIKHGKGIHKWPDGSIYEGKYNNGIREGKAKYKWADGRIFKGYFKDGKPEGKGKITYNGITIECEYKNGKPTSDITKLFKTS